jgi:FKBP-type peptidyl-prolyl cis-trans isomerase SlyD
MFSFAQKAIIRGPARCLGGELCTGKLRTEHMQVTKDTVVSFHYDLSDQEGQQLESNRDADPIAYLHGAGNIIPGLEQAMEGKTEGDSLEVTVSPDQAYGERQDNLIQRLPLKHFKKMGKLKPGMRLQVPTDNGPRVVVVIKVGRFMVDVDANHPMAGMTLTFKVDITEVREATNEEKNHGHAHGVGGHHHE